MSSVVVRVSRGASAALLVLLGAACGRSQRGHTTANGAASVASAASSAPIAGAAHAEARASAWPEPRGLDCEELGRDGLSPDEPPGKGTPRYTTVPSPAAPAGWIAYQAAGNVWRVSSDGAQRMRFGRGWAPRWFPDGRQLAFFSDLVDGAPRLFVTTFECGTARALSGPLVTQTADGSGIPSPEELIHFAVSPGGGYVAYTSPTTDGSRDLFVVDVATGAARRIATAVDGVQPAWSPDERFLEYSAGDGTQSRLFAFELSTGAGRKTADVYAPALAFGPDGSLFFQSALGGSFAIEDRVSRLYVAKLDGSAGAPQELPSSNLLPGYYYELAVSPDGRTLAASWAIWTGNGPAAYRDHGLQLRPLPAGRPRDLGASLAGETYVLSDPSFAPDSRHLAFTLAFCPENMYCREKVVVADAAAPGKPFVFLAEGSAPAWRPREPTP